MGLLRELFSRADTSGGTRADIALYQSDNTELPDELNSTALSTDAEGHEHKGKGEGGGQFTGKGGGGGSGGDSSAAGEPKGPVTRLGRIWRALFGGRTTASVSGKSIASPLDSAAVKDRLAGKTKHKLGAGGLGGSYEDTMLTDIMKETDRASPPRVVSSADMDRLVNENGWTPMYRALDKAEQVEQFKTGDLYSGAGIYGNGTYTAKRRPWQASEEGARKEVLNYGQHRMRMAVPPNAHVVSHQALVKEQAAYQTALARDLQSGRITMPEYEKMLEVVDDLGRFAALRNYDMIDASTASGTGYCVVLNRSMLAVQQEPV